MPALLSGFREWSPGVSALRIAACELRWRGLMNVCVAMNESTMSVTEVCREVAAHCWAGLLATSPLEIPGVHREDVSQGGLSQDSL